MKAVTLAGTEFRLADEPPKMGRILNLLRKESKGEMAMMAAYVDFMESMLHPDEDRYRFGDVIDEMDESDIVAALHEVSEVYKADPISAGQPSSSNSAGGQPTGEGTSRVVSFSRGTVEIADSPLSSTG